MGIVSILLMLVVVYSVAVAVFIIMENRSPQSTFAWLLFLVSMPGVGLLVYLFVGRDHRVFTRARKLTRQQLGLEALEAAELDRLEQATASPYKRRLLRLARANSTSALTVQNELEVLQDAILAYPRLIADMRAARSSIHLEYYIWAADEFTEQLKPLLAQKIREGVEVRLLFDPIGSFSALNWKYIREMRAHGVQMQPFSPLYRLHTIAYRNHRKIAVIDGAIGHMGGMNIGQEALDGGPGFTRWRDTTLRVEGEAALSLQRVFATDWLNATGSALEPRHFPSIEAKRRGQRLPMQMTTSGPDSEWEAIRQQYFLMILSAERRVYVQSPFFIPDASIAEALTAAALADVDVRVMLAPRGGRYQFPYWAANTYVRELAAAGVRFYFYRAGYFHPKTLIVDGEVCSVGSANMDIRSFSINYEINSIVYDHETAQGLERDFLADLEACDEFSLEAYEARGSLVHLRDSLARLLSPLL